MKYKICTDRYAGYEVRFWRWWFPFYVTLPVNTFRTIEAAREYALTGGSGSIEKGVVPKNVQ